MKQIRNSRLLRAGVVLLIWVSCWLLTTCQAQAAPTVLFQDDFSLPLGSNWRVARNEQWPNHALPCMNQSQPAQWEVTQQQLKIELQSSPCITDITPVSLNVRDIPSYTMLVRITMPESVDMDRSIPFLWQDPNNAYDLKLYGHSILLQKIIDGTSYTLANNLIDYPFQVNQSYLFKIEVFQQDHFRIWINQDQVMDVKDQAPFLPTTTTKTIALRGGVGAVWRSVTLFDDVTVQAELTPSDVVSLNVPLFKQHNPLWKDQLYDTASSWSDNPTIHRWGCALSSMAMILRYHKINALPTGEAITPATLNTWLRAQADGYISGAVNWLAVTRLTRLISAKYGSPKLEFSGASGTSEQNIASAKTELQQNRPSILGIPGHFLVADGWNKKTGDVQIKDPAYSYTALAQHQQPVSSIRRFTPSNTDLSYLLFVVPQTFTATLRNEVGQSIALDDVTEYMTDPTEVAGTSSPRVRLLMAAKPASGDYQLAFAQNEATAYEVSAYLYDVAGNVVIQKKTGTVGSAGDTFDVHFDRNDQAVVTPTPTPTPAATVQPSAQPSGQPTSQLPIRPSNWRQFRMSLRTIQQLRQLRHMIVAVYMDYLAQLAERAPRSQQSQYARILESVLRTYRPFFTPAAANRLGGDLRRL